MHRGARLFETGVDSGMVVRLSSSDARRLGIGVQAGSKSMAKVRTKKKPPAASWRPEPSGSIRFTLPFRAVPKERHRHGVGRSFTPERTRNFESEVRRVAAPLMRGLSPFTGAVEVSVLFIFKVPKSWPPARRRAALEGIVRPVARPDLDNIEKSIFDALNKLVHSDDAILADKHVAKFFGTSDRIEVRIRRAPSEEWLFAPFAA